MNNKKMILLGAAAVALFFAMNKKEDSGNGDSTCPDGYFLVDGVPYCASLLNALGFVYLHWAGATDGAGWYKIETSFNNMVNVPALNWRGIIIDASNDVLFEPIGSNPYTASLNFLNTFFISSATKLEQA